MNNNLNNPVNNPSNSEETGFAIKENELSQIKEMFGATIDEAIIDEYWATLSANYEQTIAALAEMVDQIDQQKRIEEEQK